MIWPIPQARTFARIGNQIADVSVTLVREGLGEAYRPQQLAAEQKAALAVG